jgi:hypothetical protein
MRSLLGTGRGLGSALLKKNFRVMKTETKTKKTFDAVEFMRQRREEISKDIEGMTPKEEIDYFKRKAAEFNKRDK